MIDAVLEFVSKCFDNLKFAKECSSSIELKGILSIMTACQTISLKAELKKQKNRIMVFIMDIISRACVFNYELSRSIVDGPCSYEYTTALFNDLKDMIRELKDNKMDFRNSIKLRSVEQVQVSNKKLGGLIKAYA